MSSPHASDSTRSVAVLRSVVGALEGLGVDSEALLERVGLDSRGLHALPSRVPIQLHNRVWEEATAVKGVPHVGLLVAGMLSLEMYDVLGGILRHSATLGDTIIRLTRFGGLLGAGFDMELRVRGEEAVLEEPHYPGPLLHLQGILCQLGMIGLVGRRLAGQALGATELRVIPQAPPYAAELEASFNVPIRFNAPHNALVFPSRHLHMPVLTEDRDRLRALELQAESLLKSLPTEPGFANTVESLLVLGLAGGSAEAVASQLDITPRTLARRLSSEGTSFQAIRDDVRRRLAESYLRRTAMPVTAIALALGFSDATAFARAFRRWTGAAPMQYRMGDAAGAPPQGGQGGDGSTGSAIDPP